MEQPHMNKRYRSPFFGLLAAINLASLGDKKDSILIRNGTSSDFGEITMRTRWSIAIHHEARGEDSLISEDHFVHFADVHQRMKRDKDKIFIVKIPATAKPMEVQAFNNLRRLGYRVETTQLFGQRGSKENPVR